MNRNIYMGKKLETIIKEQSQKDIAKKMKTSPQNLSKIIRNLKQGKGITTTTLFSLLDALEIEITDILPIQKI